MAGYSQRTLVEKLGIKPNSRIAIVAAPEGFDELLGPLPDGVKVVGRIAAPLDYIHVFSAAREELAERFGALKAALVENGMLWVSWPKKASGVETDLNENLVRDIGLSAGLVDVKVCAVDHVWSGLKFVYRRADRGRR